MTVRTVDFGEKSFRSDPYPAWDELRAAGPVHRDVAGDWIAVTYAAVADLLRDARVGKDLRRLSGDREELYVQDSVAQRYMEKWIEIRVPSMHRRWRRLVLPGFTARAVAGLREPMRRVADDLLAAIPDGDSFDFMERFARVFPVTAIASVLGLDHLGTERLARWSEAIGEVLEPGADAERQRAGDAAFETLAECLDEEVRRRRRRPGGDFLTRLVAGSEEMLTAEELVATIALLFLSGIDTTASLLANGLLGLSGATDQADLLRARPRLIPAAVEEMLRFDGPACVVVRATYRPVEVGDVRIPAGELLLLAIGAANRDPAAFTDPHRLAVDRHPNRHLAFGGGDHHCAGTGLARLQAAVAFEAVLSRYPRVEIDESAVRWLDARYLRGPAVLPARVYRSRTV